MPTNESAVIEYEGPDGDTKDEDFPVPTVIVGEKKSEPGLEKWIVITETTTTEDEDESTTTTEEKKYVKQDDVAAGDTVTFQLTSNVPNLESYMVWSYDANTGTATAEAKEGAEYTLIFHDEMDEALTFNESSVTVTIGNTVLDNTEDVTYYTVTTSTTDDCTFEVSMDLIALCKAGKITEDDWASTAIVVTYTATLSKTASAGTYKNEAWVTYLDDESEHDVVEVDIYGISVFKYDQATATYATETVDETGTETTSTLADATGLAGAVFTVYSDEECTVEVATITTGADGYATLEGLDAGAYYLKETEAPTGYVCSDTVLTVVIPDNVETDNIAYVTVANAEIPSTGGAGTVIFTVVGGGLIVAAAAVLLISRRKHEDEE
ncbi:MAG: isopeptide-forming domain-containing fimbrial protein [Firmicutes bacterium]|nr:isopeptide-forming domain-containing fimbrial protein [Bacillota bacterium]